MNPEFWHARWNKNEIGFHESNGNALLKQFFNQLALEQGDTVFVPLCGKTKDIAWLLLHGMNVVAIELNENAVQQLFEEMHVDAVVSTQGEFKLYTAENIKVFVGDFFKLTPDLLGYIGAVYDRGALVALPSELRDNYVLFLMAITNSAKQLTICYEYPQHYFKGPPFSVDKQEVLEHYDCSYTVHELYREEVKGGFRGFDDVFEVAYLLT